MSLMNYTKWKPVPDETKHAATLAPIHGGLRTNVADWPTPRPIESRLPPVKQLDPDLLPDALRDYVFDVSDRQQSPPDFVAVAGLCGLAALAGNDVRIRPKAHDDWEAVPNLWGVLVGRPSSMKSPGMNAALSPIFEIESADNREWEAEQKQREIDAALQNISGRTAAQEAAKAIKAGDNERARRAIASHIEGEPESSTRPRLVVNDATVEKLGELLNENRHGLLLVRDELSGFLSKLESDDHQSDRAFYLEAFNGDGSFTYDRIGRGTVRIERATISMIGGIQPSKVAPLVRGAMTGARDDGLLQRLQLAVWPDDLKEWTWTDRAPNARAQAAYFLAFQNMKDFARNLNAPVTLRFCEKAQGYFREWLTALQQEVRRDSLPGPLESHLQKMSKTVTALALVFELVEGGRESVGGIATARALDWAEYLKSHATRLYGSGAMMAEGSARLIAKRRDQLPEKFTGRDVQRKGWAGLYDQEAVADALDVLVQFHHLRATVIRANEGGGRPSTVYEWNPKLNYGG
jgi:hypothetical protein